MPRSTPDTVQSETFDLADTLALRGEARCMALRGHRRPTLLSGCVVAALLTCLLPAQSLFAAEPLPSQQPGDDVVAPLQPVKPRSVEEQNRVQALSWFMTGRLLESQRKSKQALDAYRKAVELDPTSVEIYRSLVPLAMELDQLGSALQLAMKAVELDPDDYELQLQIGLQFARQGEFAAAIKYLEQALKSTRLNEKSPAAVMLSIELAVLYQVTEQPKLAAERYKLVFDALKKPSDFGLEFRARSALMADPRTSYERIGQVFMDGGELKLAAEAFDLAEKSNRVSAGNLIYHRARLAMLSDKPEEALELLQRYFNEQRQSKGRDAYQLLADILAKLDRADELVGRLEQLSERDPRNQQLQYFYADALMNANELERAKQVYEAALEKAADSAGYLGLAGVLRRMKRADELLDVLGRGLSKLGEDGLSQFDTEVKAIIADETIVDALVAAGRAQAKAEPPQLSFEEGYLLGKITSELERFDDAIEFFRLAAGLDKDRAVLAYRDLGNTLMDAQRYAEAAVVYNDALQLPRLPAQLKAQFYLSLTQSRELSGDTAGALQAANDARQEFPQVPLFAFQEGWIYYHSRQFDEAIKRFEQLMETYPDEKDIVRRCQFSLSAIYVIQGDIPKGEKILEDVFAQTPEDPAVNNDLGYLYADQGKNLEQAEKMIRKAVAAEPDNAAYLDSLGWVLFKLGKFEEAVEPLEKAAKQESSSDGTIWDHLGDAYHKLNRMDDAVKAWQRALEKSQAEKHPDLKLIEKIQVKLKEHAGAEAKPKPATPGNP